MTHIMNVEEIAEAMVKLGRETNLRLQMGENGYHRLMARYRVEFMQDTYWHIYRDFAESCGVPFEEDPVRLPIVKGQTKEEAVLEENRTQDK